MNLGRKFAFTLSEVVVVMAIIGILLAASAPVVTKRTGLTNKNMHRNFTINIGHTGIYYGTTGDSKTVVIGDNNIDDNYLPSDSRPKLLLFSKNNSSPQLILGQKTTETSGSGTASTKTRYGGYILMDDNFNTVIGGPFDNTNKTPLMYSSSPQNGTIIGSNVFGGTNPSIANITAIGANSCINESSSNSIPSDSVCIGYGSGITGSTEITNSGNPMIFIGNGGWESPGNVVFGNDTLLDHINLTPSDIRLKNLGKEFTDGTNKLNQLTPYNFTYKRDTKKEPKVGVMAQDLQKVFPRAVKKNNDGYLYIRKDEMLYATINSIKELFEKMANNKEKIKTLEAKNATLKKQNKELQELYVELANRVNKI